MSGKKLTKTCSVCGEKAFGFNFGSISCESCKAFFRRNASKLHLYICPFEDSCGIDQNNRKYCRKCRLRKCFAVGMKQEWILSEKEREDRRIKIEKNKQDKVKFNKKRNDKKEPCSQTESISSDSSEKFEVNNIIDENSTTNNMQIQKYLTKESDNNFNLIYEIHENTYQEAVELEMADLLIPRSVNNNLRLTEVECTHLIELFKTTMIFKSSYPLFTVNKIEKKTGFDDLLGFFFSKFECFTRKYIQVIKGLNSFTDICENDQIALVKYSILEVLIMRSAIPYNYKEEEWSFVMENNNCVIFKLDILRNKKRNIYQAYKSYLHQITTEWDNDTFILDLLMVILLFNPNRPNLFHKESIKCQQRLYMYLLHRYLQFKYKSVCESRVKFLRILNVIQDLDQLQEIHRLNWLEADPRYFGPLFKEVLDFNIENQLTLL